MALLVALHVFLAALVALNNWPLIARLMQSPPAYVPGRGFFSPVVELVLVGYLAAAAGLRMGGRWAWLLSLSLQGFHSLTDGSVVRADSLEILFARSPFPWPLPYAANLLILILLFLPSVMARCRMDRVMSALDPILVRLIGFEQIGVGCVELLLPWGYLMVFLPAALALAVLNFAGVPQAFARRPGSRGRLLSSQAITALLLGAWHLRVGEGQGLATVARWLMAVEVFATSASAYLGAAVLGRVLLSSARGSGPANAPPVAG